MDDRIARLEEKTDHMQADIGEIKSDIRRLDATIAALKDSVNALRIEMTSSIAALRNEMTGSIAGLRNEVTCAIAELRTEMTSSIAAVRVEMKDSITALRTEMTGSITSLRQEIADLKISRWVDRVWWLLLSGVLLGVMARGFKWI